jgi:eukaryotic-like serine/threonine-protein kinase
VTLHELITGERPIDDATLAALPFAPEGLSAYVTRNAAWSQLVADCLALDPEVRPRADELVRRLTRLLERRTGVGDGDRCPFPGLAAFSRHDAADYFGRSTELDAIVAQLDVHPLIPIIGPSGIGKSSFVYAALLPRLSGAGRWDVCALRPGSSPFHNLASALVSRGDEHPALESSLRTHAGTLASVLHTRAAEHGAPVLLFVDQFEESFTLAAHDAVAFCECLALAAQIGEPWRIVVTIRDDFFHRLTESPAMRSQLGAVLPLAPLASADLRAAVLGPLDNVGYTLDPADLVERIVADVAGQPACLPLLQFTCQSLWERRNPVARRVLGSEYAAIGGASGALAAHAQRLISELPPAQVPIVRALLLALLHPDGTGRPRLRAELLDGMPPEAAAIVDRLLERRLIVASRETQRTEPRLEVAHEALSTAWPQLARWLDETHEGRLLLAEIEQASQLWERRGCRADETWTGPAVGEAFRKVSAWNLVLPSIGRAFLEAGLERDRRSRRRRRWVIATVLGFFAAIAVTALLVALAFARQDREAHLAAADMGIFDLELEPFDWDVEQQRPKPPMVPPQLSWQLYRIDPRDVHEIGPLYDEQSVSRGVAHWEHDHLVERVEVRSGPAFFEISRGPCPASMIRVQRLPGYTERGVAQTLRFKVPTCQASQVGTIEIPAGDFYASVAGPDDGAIDRVVDLPRFAIDRTEVTAGAFAVYGTMATWTGDAPATAPHLDLGRSGHEWLPAVGINFYTARNFCRFLGKELPSVEQWQKAVRGGLVVDGAPNPEPRRLAPWRQAGGNRPANLATAARDGDLAPVGGYPEDESPYHVVDLAGNVSEWSAAPATNAQLRGLRVVLGANWDTPADLGHHLVTWHNTRPNQYLDFALGVRCVMH